MPRARNLALAAAAFAVCLVPAGCGKKTPPQMPPPVVEVVPVVQRDVPVYREAIGTLDGYVNAQIRPQVDGYLLKQAYKEGSLVRPGDPLYLIEPRQFQAALDQAKGQLARAEAALENARQTVARYGPLAAENAISQQELDNAIATERQAQASVESARAALATARNNLNWTNVTAPIQGIAGKSTAQLGDLVTPQTVLTTVSQVDPIKLIFPISEQSYMRYAGMISGGSAPPIQLILADGSTHPHQGRLLFANRQVDVKTGTITLEAAFPNPGNLLRPGQYGKARGAADLLKGAVLVPQRAVVELQGNYMVAVVGPDNKVEMRPIQRGQPIEESFVVEKGLKPGERVVVEGVQKVRPGQTVDPKPASAGGPSATPSAPAAGA